MCRELCEPQLALLYFVYKLSRYSPALSWRENITIGPSLPFILYSVHLKMTKHQTLSKHRSARVCWILSCSYVLPLCSIMSSVRCCCLHMKRCSIQPQCPSSILDVCLCSSQGLVASGMSLGRMGFEWAQWAARITGRTGWILLTTATVTLVPLVFEVCLISRPPLRFQP